MKKSFILNIIIVVLVLITCTSMFVGFRFMPDQTLLELNGTEMFKFYTVDSNILIGIVSFILAIFEYKLLRGKIDKIPESVYILKMIGTAAITLTFIVTLFFLAPLYGFYAMYNNNNLFFHLITPILSIISYIFFEKYDNKYRYAFLGILPMFIYSIYYTSMVLIHINDDGLTFKYDFYGFLQGNINNIYIVIPSIFIFSFIISILLIFFNKKTSSKK